MGYNTTFEGEFTVSPPMTPEHVRYLDAFAGTRRMKRDPELTATLPDPVREAANLPVGIDGGYYVGNRDGFGQDHTPNVVNYNDPPAGQPGLWCQWVPAGPTAIEWDGGEKFYEYTAWIEYLIEHFLAPWGYTVDGEVFWSGEEEGDLGKIVVEDNVVTEKQARIVYD